MPAAIQQVLFCETYNCEGTEQLQNGHIAYGRYSYTGKKMPGKIFSRHLFHLCGSEHKSALADTW